jgi:aryl-alcohol dehydrogenase-like predicted oxidoreductase
MSAFSPRIVLGSTGLSVSRMGLAASYGATSADVERAFEHGINFFYWGSMRTDPFGSGLRALGARSRGDMVVVLQSYARSAKSIASSLDRALRSLGFDHADVLLLGWWNFPPRASILDAAAELVQKGKARAVMMSCHHRPTFAQLARDPRVQLLMMRYNAAHPGAEQDVFPHLPTPRPGVVSYTSTSWRQLLDPKLTPPGERTPTATDCYRFVLTSPFVDACWAGVKGEQLEVALRAVDMGPMSDDEAAAIKRVGANVRERTRARTSGMAFADRLINLASGFGLRSTRG